MTTTNWRKNAHLVYAVCTTLAIALASGCATGPDESRASQGARTGAAIGLGLGLLVGVLSGDADKAARAVAVGAASGAISGGYEGWKQDQDDERARQITAAIRDSGSVSANLDTEARQREELTRFLGTWSVDGWVLDDGTQRKVTAQVFGDVQMMHFVEMAWVEMKIEGIDAQIWGTTMLGYSSGNGYSISTRFNTAPDAFAFDGGSFDASQRTFTFDDGQAVTSIRFSTPDRFTATTTSNGTQLESYTFTKD